MKIGLRSGSYITNSGIGMEDHDRQRRQRKRAGHIIKNQKTQMLVGHGMQYSTTIRMVAVDHRHTGQELLITTRFEMSGRIDIDWWMINVQNRKFRNRFCWKVGSS